MASRSDDDTRGLKALGKSGVDAVGDGPDASILEVFPNRNPGRDYVIAFDFPEFTSLCPVTGQPDFGRIQVHYIPESFCVESKSFKLYMFSFRCHQSFMETITNRILDDLVSVLKPRWLEVCGLFAPRGATAIHVFVEKYGDLSSDRLENVKEVIAGFRSAGHSGLAARRF